MADICSTCGHERSLSRCWRLTCPSNGARESFQHVRDQAKRESAAAAQRIAFGHPAQWPLPRGEAAQDAFERDLLADVDEDDL